MPFVVDKNKIAKNTIALYFRMGITMVIAFFTARVTLEQLGVNDYGLNNLVGSIVSMLSFLNGSMGTAVQRFYSVEIGKNNESGLGKIFGVSLSLHFIVALVTLLLAEVFAVFFLQKMNIPADRMNAAQIVFQISIFSLVLSIVNVPYAALLRARELFSEMAVVEIIQSFLRLGVLYLLIVIRYDKIVVLSLLNLGVTIYYVGVLTYLARKFSEAHTLPCWNNALVKRMLSFISMLIITVLASLGKIQGVVFLINLFFGLAVNAAFAIAVQVSNMLNNFVSSFKQSVVPQLMASYGSGDLKTMSNLINKGTKITFILLLLMTMPIIFESEFLLRVWLKTVPLHAPQLVSLALMEINITSFTYFQYQGVHATAKINGQQICMCLAYAMNIVLIYCVFKGGLNFYSALYINMLIGVIQCMFNLYYAHKTYQYQLAYFLKNVFVPCLITVLTVGFTLQLICNLCADGLCRFVLVVLCSTILIAFLGYTLILDMEERNYCRSIISDNVRRFC